MSGYDFLDVLPKSNLEQCYGCDPSFTFVLFAPCNISALLAWIFIFLLEKFANICKTLLMMISQWSNKIFTT